MGHLNVDSQPNFHLITQTDNDNEMFDNDYKVHVRYTMIIRYIYVLGGGHPGLLWAWGASDKNQITPQYHFREKANPKMSSPEIRIQWKSTDYSTKATVLWQYYLSEGLRVG